jgi:hypothetical protein
LAAVIPLKHHKQVTAEPRDLDRLMHSAMATAPANRIKWWCKTLAAAGLEVKLDDPRDLEFFAELQSEHPESPVVTNVLFSFYSDAVSTIDTFVHALASFPHLTSLSVESFRLEDESLKVLSDLPSLTCLRLKSCRKITDFGLQHVAKIPTIEVLEISDNENITDDGIRHFSQMTSLKHLRLIESSNLTKRCLKHLVHLPLLDAPRMLSSFCGTHIKVRRIYKWVDETSRNQGKTDGLEQMWKYQRGEY